MNYKLPEPTKKGEEPKAPEPKAEKPQADVFFLKPGGRILVLADETWCWHMGLSENIGKPSKIQRISMDGLSELIIFLTWDTRFFLNPYFQT